MKEGEPHDASFDFYNIFLQYPHLLSFNNSTIVRLVLSRNIRSAIKRSFSFTIALTLHHSFTYLRLSQSRIRHSHSVSAEH